MIRDALIVGINAYDNLNNLASPAQDAEALAQLLKTYGEFNITRLPAVKDKNTGSICMGKKTRVTLEQLEESLVRLFKPDGWSIPDTALFFFSGHGIRRCLGIQEGFLATSDVNPSSGARGLSLQWLRRLIQESKVRQQVILLDCCYAGEIMNFAEADPGHLGKGRDRCFIAASREFEVAYEETSGIHGVFSSAILEALDPRHRHDGIVNNTILSESVTIALQGAIQRPVFSNSGEPIVLTHVQEPITYKTITPDAVCPYRGLRYFDFTEEDSQYFYGRTELVDELLEKIRSGNFLAVIGPSGSGKSSVVRAGLLCQLAQGNRLSGSDTWPIRLFHPGDDPFKSLVEAFRDSGLSAVERAVQLEQPENPIKTGTEGLERLIRVLAGDHGRVVLVVDQFEEVFTLCGDMKKRTRFLEILLEAFHRLENKLCLIITMRADFFAKCSEQEYAGLSELIQSNLITVRPMDGDELEEAIVKPAELTGIAVEQELVSQMIDDVQGSPGSLPLLQFTLTELWNRRETDELKLTSYIRMGGVKETLSKRAGTVYEGLDENEKSIARRIFINLTQLGEGTEDTRRQVAMKDLIPTSDQGEMVKCVIGKLADAKLIVTGEILPKDNESSGSAVVDVAHEALIRHWPLLRAWLHESRNDTRFHRRLEQAASHWKSFCDTHGRPQAEGLLWRSPNLELLIEFHRNHPELMTEVQADFFHDSKTLQTKEKQEKETALKREIDQANALAEEQRKRALAIEQASKKQRLVNGFIFALALILCGFYIHQRSSTKHINDLNCKNYLSKAVNEVLKNPLKSFHYFANAAKFETQENLLDYEFFVNMLKEQPVLEDISKDDGLVNEDLSDIEYSDLLFKSEDRTSLLMLPKDKQIKHDGRINGAILNRDESRVLSWSEDGTARLWNADNGSQIATMKHKDDVIGAVFNNDETRILTWSWDGTVRLWNANDGSPLGVMYHDKWFVRRAEFSKDESRILTWGSDGMVRRWRLNMATGFEKILFDQTHRNFQTSNLALLVERYTGTTMSDDGKITVLDSDTWQKKREEYNQD